MTLEQIAHEMGCDVLDLLHIMRMQEEEDYYNYWN